MLYPQLFHSPSLHLQSHLEACLAVDLSEAEISIFLVVFFCIFQPHETHFC